MRSTFRWTTALSGLGIVTTSLLSAQAGFSKTTTSKMGTAMAPKMAAKSKTTRTQMTGTVVSQKGTTLTIMPLRGSKTATIIMVPTSAKVMSGKKAVATSTVMKGDKVCVYMTNGKVTRVDDMGMPRMKMGSKLSTMSKK